MCEITDRNDLGTDLKCPQTDEGGSRYWSYDLIRGVRPGEIVFHYSTPKRRAFVGASIAGSPLEERPIVWTPHGTVGRAKSKKIPEARPGLRLPLHRLVSATHPLTLRELNEPEDQAWIRSWIEAKGKGAMAPLQRYPKALRGAQGYLVKMPADRVERWPKLRLRAEQLADSQDEFAAGAPIMPISGTFAPKSEEEYVANIAASRQVKTRHHERLVRLAGEQLRALGAAVSTPHPIDLLVTAPHQVVFEAKAVGSRDPLLCVREAIGQLLVYRHFVLKDGKCPACILLNKPPGPAVVEFVEGVAGFMIAWLDGSEKLCWGTASAARLPLLGKPTA